MGTRVPGSRMRFSACFAVLVCALGMLVATSTASAQAPTRPFAPDSVWNTPAPRSAKLDPASDRYVRELRRQVGEFGPWINSVRFSSPVYTVGADQPPVRVTLDRPSSRLQAALEAVPLPPDAVPGAGTQKHLVVRQPATDTMWEFWKLTRQADGWHAMWGGKMEKVSSNPGYFLDRSWGATATGLPLMGGMITLKELRRGRIDHALAFSIPEVRRGVFSWPAQRTDGQIASSRAIPHGTRFRIDPKLNLRKLHLPPVTYAMARAAQKYGLILRDKAGAVTFYAEDPAQFGIGDPYPKLYGNVSPSRLTRQFPWEHLQVLDEQPPAAR